MPPLLKVTDTMELAYSAKWPYAILVNGQMDQADAVNFCGCRQILFSDASLIGQDCYMYIPWLRLIRSDMRSMFVHEH